MSYVLFATLGLLPSFAWLLFFLREDIHPEPKKLIAKVFFYGALVTVVATGFQFLFRYGLGLVAIGQYAFVSFLIFGTIEEVLKFAVAYKAVSKSSYFDEPVDAMIYMIAAGLGFAVVENIFVMFSIEALGVALGVIVLRFVGATLLHALSSALVGYYWALSLIKARKKELIIGLASASLLHALFNYLIMKTGNAMFYPVIFLIIVALFVFWDFEQMKTRSE